MTTVFAFILVLGLLIFVHEIGHFLVAKACGIRVLKFSLGFGPRLVGKTIGDTEYLISALPLGGYVKMLGENPDEQELSQEERAVSFSHKAVWQRFLVVFAGPACNFLFPIVLFWMIFLAAGVPYPVDSGVIGQVNDHSPAAQAGLKAGDRIVTINGNKIATWQDVLDGIKGSDGKALTITVMRGQVSQQMMVTPVIDSVKNFYGEEVGKRYMIGIVKDDEKRLIRVGPLQALSDAWRQSWDYVKLTVIGFVKIVQRVIPASELGGPILIAQIAGQQMERGWMNLCFFIGLLSVNLAVLNLLPVPVLDGGHLFFLTLEGIRGKPLAERAQIVAQQVGLALLGMLMIFVFYNDIVRIVRHFH
ncbi:MAG: RIP metalloprotease RseP [Desulfobulbaceae bacterium]|jgi:regulator of sigma E protease|nr:RIP metalloprotease RseP [Desulfobulbaceae bacterium]